MEAFYCGASSSVWGFKSEKYLLSELSSISLYFAYSRYVISIKQTFYYTDLYNLGGAEEEKSDSSSPF
jgi:hypothetical protein